MITRFPPSPTGLFHIGSARTALFNYLWAKKNGGKFVLRFEDTDKERSKKEFEKDILDGLAWLGITHDNQLFRQSERLHIYQAYAEKLIKLGLAYHNDNAVFFKVSSYPYNEIVFEDQVHGQVKFARADFQDIVLIKADKMPTYNFAVVIDDYEQGVTDVIRGDDHISNTPKQIMIAAGLGFPILRYAHLPLILNEDRSKMSKRKNPVSVTKDYRTGGYLSESIVNFIALLGWNPGNEQEFFTIEELIKTFSLERIGKSGAVFDLKKLKSINHHYLMTKPEKGLLSMASLYLYTFHRSFYRELEKLYGRKDFLKYILPTMANRLDVLSDLLEIGEYLSPEPKSSKKLLVFKKSSIEKTLRGLKLAFHQLSEINSRTWLEQDFSAILSDILQSSKDLGAGDLYWPIRVALSGQEKSPSPEELLTWLGKEKVLKRLKTAIEILE